MRYMMMCKKKEFQQQSVCAKILCEKMGFLSNEETHIFFIFLFVCLLCEELCFEFLHKMCLYSYLL